MARRTFFSFHYKPDATRAWVVRNSWVAKVAQGEREDAGFFDSSVFEAAQRTSDDALKSFLSKGLKNTSVTCVLVGTETALRRWVRYEIFRSFICGNGIFAVRIHTIADLRKMLATKGPNPFDNVAFTLDGDQVRFKEYMTNGWQSARDVGSMRLNEVTYDLDTLTNHTLSNLFPIYDWDTDDGFSNLGEWIEAAASQAVR